MLRVRLRESVRVDAVLVLANLRRQPSPRNTSTAATVERERGDELREEEKKKKEQQRRRVCLLVCVGMTGSHRDRDRGFRKESGLQLSGHCAIVRPPAVVR
jgi:hypothetical protein